MGTLFQQAAMVLDHLQKSQRPNTKGEYYHSGCHPIKGIKRQSQSTSAENFRNQEACQAHVSEHPDQQPGSQDEQTEDGNHPKYLQPDQPMVLHGSAPQVANGQIPPDHQGSCGGLQHQQCLPDQRQPVKGLPHDIDAEEDR